MNRVQRLEALRFLNEHGNCAGLGQEEFYPGDGQHADKARRVCMACGIRAECLAYADAAGETYGVWGGETADDRRRRRSRQARESRERRAS